MSDILCLLLFHTD